MKLSIKVLCILAMLLIIAAVPAGADTTKRSVAISDIQVYPAAFMPGDTGTITVTLTNPLRTLTGGTTTASDTYNYGAGVSNGMTTPAHSATTSSTNTNTPDGSYVLKEVRLEADGPVHVTPEVFADVGRMGMGDTARFNFTVKIDNNAVDTVYRLTLRVRTDDDAVYLNYPVSVKVDSNVPQLIVSKYAETYNGTDKNTVSLDVTNPRGVPIDSVKVIAAGDEFVFEPQDFYIGTLKAGDMYTADFKVDSRGDTYNTTPQFTMVYRNGDNWHQTGAVSVVPHPARKTWWDTWWPFLALGAVCLVAVIGLTAALARRFGKVKGH
jgi:hypothetical protein